MKPVLPSCLPLARFGDRLALNFFAALLLLAGETFAAPAPVPGRLFSQTGASWGGILAFNPGGSFDFNLTPHTFAGSTAYNRDQRTRTSYASVSDDGRIMAVLSERAYTVGGPAGQYVYVLNGDGSNIRQITFPYYGGYSDDAPVISPDGTRVAFISRRETNVFNGDQVVRNPQLYIINTDGSNLTQITFGGERINPGDLPTVRTFSADWAPDGQRLAYRGLRIIRPAVGNPYYDQVVGIIDLQAHTDIVIFGTGSTGQSFGLDWSPSGKYIVAGYGGEAQGAPQGRILIYNTQTSLLTEDFRFGNWAGGAGQIRVAPDDSFYVIPYADGSFTPGYRLVSLEAPNEIRSYPLGIAGPFYWQPGPNWPRPARLEAQPAYREIPRGFDGLLQVNAVLYGNDGSVMSRMAASWDDIESGSYTTQLSQWGDMRDNPFQRGGYSRFRAYNAGLTADLIVQNGKAKVVFDDPRVSEYFEWRIDVRSRNIGDGQVGFGANNYPLATLSGVPMNTLNSIAIPPNSTIGVRLTIPEDQTSSGPKILRLRGAYPGGSYAASLRVTIP